jgi:hypothetical protein
VGNEHRLSGSSKKVRKAVGQPISAACGTCCNSGEKQIDSRLVKEKLAG